MKKRPGRSVRFPGMGADPVAGVVEISGEDNRVTLGDLDKSFAALITPNPLGI